MSSFSLIQLNSTRATHARLQNDRLYLTNPTRHLRNTAMCGLCFIFPGEALNIAYLPVIVPFGVIGNILSFLVIVEIAEFKYFYLL